VGLVVVFKGIVANAVLIEALQICDVAVAVVRICTAVGVGRRCGGDATASNSWQVVLGEVYTHAPIPLPPDLHGVR